LRRRADLIGAKVLLRLFAGGLPKGHRSRSCLACHLADASFKGTCARLASAQSPETALLSCANSNPILTSSLLRLKQCRSDVTTGRGRRQPRRRRAREHFGRRFMQIMNWKSATLQSGRDCQRVSSLVRGVFECCTTTILADTLCVGPCTAAKVSWIRCSSPRDGKSAALG
jgi:hypothetical protein